MRSVSRTVMIGVLGLSAALLLGRLAAVHAEPGAQDPVSNEECLACHQAPAMTWTLPSGEVRSATIDPEGYRTSVHGKEQIPCTDCHGQTGGYPHPTPEAPTSREFRVRSSEACRTCHGEKFELVQDSVHQRALEAGNLDAPVCVDCHGAHEIRPPASNLVFAAAACGQCHVEIYGDYLESVHGSALLEENPDVPTCTTCHSVHSIQSPATVQFRAQSPELCGSCHTDETRMAKYGLSTDV